MVDGQSKKGKRGYKGSNRVIRGGSWNNNAVNLRSANRNNDSPGNRNNNIGFRLANTEYSQNKYCLRIVFTVQFFCLIVYPACLLLGDIEYSIWLVQIVIAI